MAVRTVSQGGQMRMRQWEIRRSLRSQFVTSTMQRQHQQQQHLTGPAQRSTASDHRRAAAADRVKYEAGADGALARPTNERPRRRGWFAPLLVSHGFFATRLPLPST